ncbi:MAG TPA: hypothetical protein VIH57_24625 [Bacteroidales bacterium]
MDRSKNFQKKSLIQAKRIAGQILTLSLLSFVFLAISCTKKNGDQLQNPSSNSCGRIEWYNTLGDSGYFQGAVLDSKFSLVAEDHYDGYTNSFIGIHHDANNHIINDHPNYTVTYNQDQIVKIAYADDTSNLAMNFNDLGQLTTASGTGNNGDNQTTVQITYTYDGNGDPVKIAVHSTEVSIQGTTVVDFNITGDYLTDNPNFLPDAPEIAPFSAYFAFTVFTSRHLINKWVIHSSGTTADGKAIPDINFTQQYTYTFDSSGKVATMVHTGNSSNIYKFTFSQCQ